MTFTKGHKINKGKKNVLGKRWKWPEGSKRNWKWGIVNTALDRYLWKREKIAGRKKPDKCEICKSVRKICFDHDHKTGKFRGWICGNCNYALGLIRDDSKILQEMIKYLEK